MRQKLSFKEFMDMVEAGNLPPDQLAVAAKIRANITAMADKPNPEDPRKIMDKAVLNAAKSPGSKNPLAVQALADAAAKKK